MMSEDLFEDLFEESEGETEVVEVSSCASGDLFSDSGSDSQTGSLITSSNEDTGRRDDAEQPESCAVSYPVESGNTKKSWKWKRGTRKGLRIGPVSKKRWRTVKQKPVDADIPGCSSNVEGPDPPASTEVCDPLASSDSDPTQSVALVEVDQQKDSSSIHRALPQASTDVDLPSTSGFVEAHLSPEPKEDVSGEHLGKTVRNIKSKYRKRRKLSMPRKGDWRRPLKKCSEKQESSDAPQEKDMFSEGFHASFYERCVDESLDVASVAAQCDAAISDADEVGDFELYNMEEIQAILLEKAKAQQKDGMECSPAMDLSQNFQLYPADAPLGLTMGSDSNDQDDDYIDRLEKILKVSFGAISSNWITSQYKGALRLIYHSSSLNPIVEQCISVQETKVDIYINNKPLPQPHYIWDVTLENPGDVIAHRDYLLQVTRLFETSTKCKGVQSYQMLWKYFDRKGLGYIEELCEKSICFRSVNCSLIIASGEICKSCRTVELKLSRSVRKKKDPEDGGKDQKKINNRFLKKKELLSKVQELQSDKRKIEKKLYKCKQYAKKLLRRDKVKVSSELNDDLCSIMHENEGKLSQVQKIFWEEQKKAFEQKSSRGIRWNPLMIKIALHLQMTSPAAYEYLRDTGVLKLPSSRTLFDYTHFAAAQEGIQKPITEELKKRLDNAHLEDHQLYFNLLFDEMHIRQDLVVSSGEIIGYTNPSKIEKEMEDLEAMMSSTQKEPQLAKKVLVFMVQGITNDYQEIVAVHSTDDLSAHKLYQRTWDLIYHLEGKGIKILSLICDGASVNRKFFRMHASSDPSVNFVYVTKNIASDERRPLFLIVDPPHLLKTVRNCLANSYAHRKTRILWKNDQIISWLPIILLLEVSLKDTYRGHKLTKAHVQLTSFSCMKVLYAAQVFSKSVARSLQRYMNDDRFKNTLPLDELIKFILLMDRFFDCLNSCGDIKGKRNKENKDLLPYKSESDERLLFLKNEFLQFFTEWEEDVRNRPGSFRDIERGRMIISEQSLEGLKITVYSFVAAVKFLLSKGAESIDGRKFSQDKLEQYFGIIRMAGGARDNPNLKEFLQKVLSLHVQGKAARPTSKGNTTVQAQTDSITEEPLPKRPRKK